MDKALNRLHGLVQIWSFECLQVLEKMSRRNSDELEENESELKFKLMKSFHELIEMFLFFLTAIIRYLGSRFQETLLATDEDNRTALHYSAIIKDNGHFYNLLVHLGANPKVIDNVRLNFLHSSSIKINDFLQLGKTAESYLNHDESDKILSHKDLLRSFGAEEDLADEMLNDQGTFFSLSPSFCTI